MQVVPIRSKAPVPEGKRAQVKAQNRRIILDAARRVIAERRANGLGPMMHQEATALISAGLKEDIHAAGTRGVLPPTDPDLLTAGICGLASALTAMVHAGASADSIARTATAFVVEGFH